MKTYRWTRGIAPLIINLYITWMGVNITLQPPYPRERTRVSIE